MTLDPAMTGLIAAISFSALAVSSSSVHPGIHSAA